MPHLHRQTIFYNLTNPKKHGYKHEEEIEPVLSKHEPMKIGAEGSLFNQSAD
jgi:hypothetical protein